MTLNVIERRFIGINCTNYNNILKVQIDSISKYIKKLPNPVVSSVSKIPKDGTNVSFIAAIFKKSNKTNSSNKIFLNDDNIYLEDCTSRINVIGIDPGKYVNGVVIGVNGHYSYLSKIPKFIVSTIFEPEYEEIPHPIIIDKYKIAFISELQINSENFDINAANSCLKKLQEEDISLFVMIGNIFSKNKIKTNFNKEWKINLQISDISPVEMFTMFCSKIKCKKIIIPGKNDPVSSIFPLNPIDPILLQDITNIISSSNPSMFYIDNCLFQCSSGDIIKHVMKNTSLSYQESQLSLIKWGLLSPSIPYVTQMSSSTPISIFVNSKLPNFFITGNSSSFNYFKYKNCNMISIPSFQQNYSSIIVDLGTGNIYENK